VSDEDEGDAQGVGRRLVLGSMGIGLALAGASTLFAAVGLRPRVREGASFVPPRPGDFLAFAQGASAGRIIRVDDVPTDGPPLFAWPMDGWSRTVRSGNPQNLVLMVRAASASWYGPGELPRTASAVAAYSAICTHLCCTVSDWEPEPAGGDPHGFLLCPCHKSHYDPWAGARVMSGPAPRPLPALPLRVDADLRLVVASGFTAPVGCGG
jgi:rieske iron-sulfur protein